MLRTRSSKPSCAAIATKPKNSTEEEEIESIVKASTELVAQQASQAAAKSAENDTTCQLEAKTSTAECASKGKGEDEDEDVVPPPLEPTEALQHTTGPGTVHDSDQFHAGLVFSTPWHETYTQNSPNPAIAVEQESETAMTRLGKVISKMRKFVILKRYPQHSVALAIWSYGGKGLEGGQIQEIMSAYVTANSMPMIGQIVRTRIFSLADWRSTRTDEANTGASSMGRLTASLRVRSRLGT